MKKSVLVLIISFLCISAWAKKNVCAITINSNHEINLFKKSLSKEQWNFIELTDYAADSLYSLKYINQSEAHEKINTYPN